MTADLETGRPPIGFAHRGARSERPENTIAAFRRALQLGATGLESDAWLSADAHVVLDHDGLTGPRWRRRPISAQARAALPAHLPTLPELYQACGHGFDLSLDIKDPAALVGVVGAAEAAGATARLWLCHGDRSLLESWRPVVGAARLVQSTRRPRIDEGIGPRAATLHRIGVDAINLPAREWDARAVADVHAAGVRAFGWGAQSSRDLVQAIGLGLDGLYSDHVDRLMAAIGAAFPGPAGARTDVT